MCGCYEISTEIYQDCIQYNTVAQRTKDLYYNKEI